MHEALSGFRSTLGDQHPDTLSLISNYALLLQAQGKLNEAEPLIREALDGTRSTLGDEHPATSTAIDNYIGLLHDQGRLAEDPEPRLLEALDARRVVLIAQQVSSSTGKYDELALHLLHLHCSLGV